MYSGGPAKSELLRRVLVAIMVRLSRFIKVDLRASSTLAYGTLVVLASLLERLAAVRDATVLASGVVHIQIPDIEAGTRANAHSYPATAL